MGERESERERENGGKEERWEGGEEMERRGKTRELDNKMKLGNM